MGCGEDAAREMYSELPEELTDPEAFAQMQEREQQEEEEDRERQERQSHYLIRYMPRAPPLPDSEPERRARIQQRIRKWGYGCPEA